MIVYVQRIRRVGFRQRSMALNDRHVFVVVITRLETQIVASRHYDTSVRERVDYHEFAVSHSETGLVELFFPHSYRITHSQGGDYSVVGGYLLSGRQFGASAVTWSIAPDRDREILRRLGDSHRAANEKRRVGILRLGDRIDDAWTSRLEDDE